MRAISQIELMKITRQNVEFQIELMKTAQLSAENAANQMRMLISDLRGVTSTAAENAERAANRMLGLIDDLKRQTTAAANIAEKAAQDTSAMKIIAILTALFLPGTFFAVSHALPSVPCPRIRFSPRTIRLDFIHNPNVEMGRGQSYRPPFLGLLVFYWPYYLHFSHGLRNLVHIWRENRKETEM